MLLFLRSETINKTLSQLRKKKKNEDITYQYQEQRRAYYIGPTDIKKIICDNYEKFCVNKFHNLDKTNLFLKGKTPKITQKEIDNTTSLTKKSNLY